MNDDDLLEQQRAFYRARAPEYDEWWQRRGRYDKGEEDNREWDRQVAVVDAALASVGAKGDVLELAGGTGWWTKRLADTAEHLTVVDASLETLALNRRRVGRADVDYVVADVFDWQPRSRLRHRVLLILAVARTAEPLRCLLVARPLLPQAERFGVLDRQPQ
jgi:SAM-dependent methyltransferase